MGGNYLGYITYLQYAKQACPLRALWSYDKLDVTEMGEGTGGKKPANSYLHYTILPPTSYLQEFSLKLLITHTQ